MFTYHIPYLHMQAQDEMQLGLSGESVSTSMVVSVRQGMKVKKHVSRDGFCMALPWAGCASS